MAKFKKRKRRVQNLEKAVNIFEYVITLISFTGLIASIGLHLMFMFTNISFKEIEIIAFLVCGAMVAPIYLINARSLRRYRMPWYANAIPILVVLYGVGSLITGPFGALDELSINVRELAIRHQTIFRQSLMIAGYVYSCFYWWQTNQIPLSKHHA